MQNSPVVGLQDIDDADVPEHAGVVRLAARRGIKRGAIEDQRRSPLVGNRVNQVCLELAQIRIGVIQSLSQDCVCSVFCFFCVRLAARYRAAGSVARASSKPRARRRQLSQ